MKVVPFLASSPVEAVQQIRAELGPEAVVLNVRQLPANGLARLWRRPAIEVLACVPDSPAAALTAPAETLTSAAESKLARTYAPHKKEMAVASPMPALDNASLAEPGEDPPRRLYQPRRQGFSRSAEILEKMGLLPLYVERVLEEAGPPATEAGVNSLSQELLATKQALLSLWRMAPRGGGTDSSPEVFVGPPGVGKTTVLCKWLAQIVLIGGKAARVWRLDAGAANMAETLSVYGEILGVPVERNWDKDQGALVGETGLVDLPGVDYQDRAELERLREIVGNLRSPTVHLVLNAAYTTSLLLKQARAFSALPISDLILTHVDEERMWGKFWNLLLGTNYSIRFLSGGQNIPGYFAPASVEQLLPSEFHQINPLFGPILPEKPKLANQLLST